MGLGLHPRIRKTRGESCSTVGKRARLPAKPVYAEIHPAILYLAPMGKYTDRPQAQPACCYAANCWSVHRDDSLDGQHKHGKR